MRRSYNPESSALGRWSVVIFARNEQAGIGRCLRSIALASAGRDVHVTMLLNGTTDGTATAAASAARRTDLTMTMFTIRFADKSNAINQFLHVLRPAAAVYFFVDAYAAVLPTALSELARALDAEPGANAAAAVPSTGRSAAALRSQMVEEHGLHGSLFALRYSFVERLVIAGLRVPIGLYRGDGLIRSFLMHDLDAFQPWEPARVAVVPTATWQTVGLSPLRLRDAQRLWSRAVRQGQGRLESATIKSRIYAGGFNALGAFAGPMIREWIAEDPRARKPSVWRDPFAALALGKAERARVPIEGDLTPLPFAPPGREVQG